MEKDYYKRYRVSFNPESDKDREIIDYLEKFSSGSGRTHALKELLYNGMNARNEDIEEILVSINEQLSILCSMTKNTGVNPDFDDRTTEIYKIFSKEYEPELKKYSSKILGFKDNEGVFYMIIADS